MSLRRTIKKFQANLAASEMFGGPSSEIQEAMKQQGWEFTQCRSKPTGIGVGSAFNCVVTTFAKTPEGVNVLGNKEAAEQYHKVRHETANRIYGV